MDKLFSALLTNAVGYFVYRNEMTYLTDVFGCKQTPSELCTMLREYRRKVQPSPTLHEFVAYCYQPCTSPCPYLVAWQDAIPAIMFTVMEYGKFISCQVLYEFIMFQRRLHRYPTEIELMMYEAANRLQSNGAPASDASEATVAPTAVKKNAASLLQQLDPYVLTKPIPDQVCCICQEGFDKDHKVYTLPCMHTFHATVKHDAFECMGIEAWLHTSTVCPLCKQELV